MTESEYLRLQDKAKKAPPGHKIKWQMRLREAMHQDLADYTGFRGKFVRAKKRKAA